MRPSDGSYLPESDAIPYFLASGTPYLPDDALGRARALSWMFFEQYSPEAYVAVLKWYRDAKIYDIFEGTGQIQRRIIAKHLTGQNPT